MIQANELRVGNLLNYDTAEGDVVTATIGWQYIQWATEDPKGFNLVHTPIPLTEDWLIKLGFEQWVNFGRKTYNYDLMPLCNFSYCFVTKKVMILEKGNNMSHWIERKIEYVHELQNLYFSLRGKELTIKN